jgi:MFS family permease
MPFALATLLGAFLVFQVQPIISKCVLPWFGGTPAVWTTCMLFFQVLLFGGYLYAHCLRTCFRLWQQTTIHFLLLIASLFTLPIEPSDAWKPSGETSPIVHLLWLLAAHVGLPYFMLSSTGPLMQAWLSTQLDGNRVYRLYALSNVGSLAALLSYPFLVEPILSVHAQSESWSWMFGMFVIVQAVAVYLLLSRSSQAREVMPSENETPHVREQHPVHRPSIRQKLSWVGLTALASTLLLTTTQHVCQDVAVIPFLWILPLSLYLVSFILCFDSPRLYHPKLYAALALFCLMLLPLSKVLPPSMALAIDLAASTGFLFLICILCHGEVARQKPSVAYLTHYYTLLSAGGAMGGLIVAVFCPMWLDTCSEQSVVITIGASLAVIILFAAQSWTGQVYDWQCAKNLRMVAMVLPLINIGASSRYSVPGVIESNRNFFGILRVEEIAGDRQLVHGTTIHGLQRKPPFERLPTTYYGFESGIGKLLHAHAERPLHVCGVGLGCGVLASYGRENDQFEFVEINPAVARIAQQHFSFLKDSKATVCHHLGDGRLVLERLSDRQFDIIALDAFSSDSIPAHLLTREAFELYQSRLTADGAIAVHVSNKHLDLAPLVHRLASVTGMKSTLIKSPGSIERQTLPALWVIAMRPDNSLWKSDAFKTYSSPAPGTIQVAPLWTDQHHNLLSVFRVPR